MKGLSEGAEPSGFTRRIFPASEVKTAAQLPPDPRFNDHVRLAIRPELNNSDHCECRSPA